MFTIVHAQGAILNEVVPTRCRSTPVSKHWEAGVLVSWADWLPAMPLPLLHSCLETASADYPLLELAVLSGRRKGAPRGQITMDRLELLSRVLGLLCGGVRCMVRGLATTQTQWINSATGASPPSACSVGPVSGYRLAPLSHSHPQRTSTGPATPSCSSGGGRGVYSG